MILFDKNLIRMFDGDGKNAGDAWAYFLNKYSKIILKVIRSYTNDYDEVMDKYLFVCIKLSENNFKLIKKYNYKDKRKAKLSTWLTVVVRNLCVDQFRNSHGRKRLPASILNLNSTERKIFKYYFYDKLSITEISRLFEPEKSIEEIVNLIDDINQSIVKGTINAGREIKVVGFNDDIEVEQISIHDQIELEEYKNIFNNLIETLEPIEKFILKLRFWEDLTVKEISSITNIPSRKLFYTLDKITGKLQSSIKREEIL